MTKMKPLLVLLLLSATAWGQGASGTLILYPQLSDEPTREVETYDSVVVTVLYPGLPDMGVEDWTHLRWPDKRAPHDWARKGSGVSGKMWEICTLCLRHIKKERVAVQRPRPDPYWDAFDRLSKTRGKK